MADVRHWIYWPFLACNVQLQRRLLILLVYAQFLHSFPSIKLRSCSDAKGGFIVWLQFLVWKCRSALLRSSSASLSVPTLPVQSVTAGQLTSLFYPVRITCGGNTGFECESHIWLFGCWPMCWFWKFTQLSAGLNTPSSTEKDHCSLGKRRHLKHTHLAMRNSPWSKEGATVEFSVTDCEMKSAVVVTSCRFRELHIFFFFTASPQHMDSLLTSVWAPGQSGKFLMPACAHRAAE